MKKIMIIDGGPRNKINTPLKMKKYAERAT